MNDFRIAYMICFLLLLLKARLVLSLFIQTPVSVNSTPNATVHFTCTVERGIPFWRINGLGLWQLPSTASLRITTQSHDGGHSSIVMYILIPEVYNNSLIQCRVATADGEIESAPVELKVQGLLAAPSNLKAVSITSTTICLTWDHPYTLDITGIDPDISGYVIYIQNAITGNATTVFATETEYTFVRQDFRHCDMFEFRVQALNVVGEGNISDAVAAAYLGPPLLTILLPSTRIPLSNWTMLACTVPCPNVVHWYTRGNPYPLQMSWPGLRVHKMSLSNCTSINGTYSEVLEIFTEAQSNVSELQCASVPVCSDTGLHCRLQTCYSEFVQLIVHMNEVEPSPTVVSSTSYSVSYSSLQDQGNLQSRNLSSHCSETQMDQTSAFLIGGVGVITTILSGIFGALFATLTARRCAKIAALKQDNHSMVSSTKEEAIYEQPLPPPSQPTQMHPCPAYKPVGRPQN